MNDKNGNLIYEISSMGHEHWYKYDKNNNLIYYKHNDGLKEEERWSEYDENNNLVYYKDKFSTDYKIEYREFWYRYSKSGKQIEITEQEFENIKIREYINRTKCSRFEIMDI